MTTQFYPLDAQANEVIFAPMHDSWLRESLDLREQPLAAKEVTRTNGGFTIGLTWQDCEPGEDAVRFDCLCDLDPQRYDRFIACCNVQSSVAIRFAFRLDGKWRAMGREFIGTSRRMEIDLRMPAQKLTGVRATLRAISGGSASSAFIWFGLADSVAVKQQLSSRVEWDPAWPGLISEKPDWQNPVFARGLFFSEEDLAALGKKKELPYWRENFALLEEKAYSYLERIPENDIGEYVPWSDNRFSRGREFGKEPLYLESLVLGFVGLINRDEAMMLHAIRYLLATVHITHWCQSAESRVKGSTWDQRCFIEELTTTCVATLLDWFDFALTPRAKELIRKAIWDKGLTYIERDMMKFEYVHHMNQGPWFCRARVLGGLMLEQAWPKTGTYVERAFQEQFEGMKNYLLPDGGTDEGIGYFSLTMNAVLWTVMAYARARGRDPATLLPSQFKSSEKFLGTMSAMRPGATLMDGDQSTDYFVGDTISILAGMFPGSNYAKIVAATLAKKRPFTYFNHYLTDGLLAMVWGPSRLSKPVCVVPVFSRMKHVGHLTSRRGMVRFHLSGSKAIPSHSHLDKGGFTLEIGEEPVLIDRGVVRYDDSRVSLMKLSRQHNILTPVAEDGTFANQDPPLEPMIPYGKGDARKLQAGIRLDHVWRSRMTKCRRNVDSPDPKNFIILDEGRLREPGRVAFHLHAREPFVIEGNTATLPGKVRIEALWATTLEQSEDGIDYRFEPVYHLVIYSSKLQAFQLTTRIELL